jgi:hypothetical protein
MCKYLPSLTTETRAIPGTGLAQMVVHHIHEHLTFSKQADFPAKRVQSVLYDIRQISCPIFILFILSAFRTRNFYNKLARSTEYSKKPYDTVTQVYKKKRLGRKILYKVKISIEILILCDFSHIVRVVGTFQRNIYLQVWGRNTEDGDGRVRRNIGT